MSLGLPVGNHVFFHAKIGDEDVLRKYTPISQVKDQTYVDFVIKIYRKNVHPNFPEGGLMTQYLETLKPGDFMRMSGPHGRLRYEGYGRFEIHRMTGTVHKKKIGHIAGGTGITPHYQVMQAALNNADETTHSLIFANRTTDDILIHNELTQLAENYPEQFKAYFTVDVKPDKSKNWKQGVGYVNKEMIKEKMPAPSPDTMILYCGPPGFTDMLTKVLKELGYTSDMLFKF